MIKDIFFPYKLGNYFLFPRTIIGVDINSRAVHVTKIVAKGEKRTVTLSLSKKIEPDLTKTAPERAALTLKSLLERVGKYDEIVSTIPSAGIIFKELEVPFTDREQITQIVPFEVEPLLPFSIDNALIDFIITNTKNGKKPTSTIMVATAPDALIEKYIAMLALAGISPDVITIDIFALYGFLRTTKFTKKHAPFVIVDIETDGTTLSLFDNNQLRLIRTLSYGSKTFLERLEKKDDLSFTVTSLFGDQKNIPLLCLSQGDDIALLVDDISKKTGYPTKILTYSQNKEITLKRTITIAPEQIISLASALPNSITHNFNLRQKEFKQKNYQLFFYQCLTATILLCVSLTMLIWHYRAQVNKLQREINSSEQEVISLLQEKFNIPEEYDTFDEVVEYAEEEASKNRATWLAFSSQARSSFLQYLLELVTIIDKKTLGFEVSRISIEQDRLILQAKVRDYDALKILERELRESPLFSYVEPQDSPDFTMTITLAPLGENV